MKISNDLRWMNSGPLAGLGEIALPALQPGSSIMPGKVNPVVPESVTMIAAQVIGNDATITIAGQSGEFSAQRDAAGHRLQSTAEPGIARHREPQSRRPRARRAHRERGAARAALDRNPILVTALNPVIGYEKGAAIAKKAYAEGRPILEVAAEMTDLKIAELRRLLDPLALTDRRHQGSWIRPADDGAALQQDSHSRVARSRTPPAPAEDMLWLAGASPRGARARARLVPRGQCRRRCSCRWWSATRVLTVLLTQRAATLKDHAGQISFPGGRIEPEDADAWQRGAARGARGDRPEGEFRGVCRIPAGSLGWEPAFG